MPSADALQCSAMQGLVVVGTGPNAGEPAVASTLAGAISGAAVFAAGQPDGSAPPAIAARHAGNEIDPGALVEEARGAGGGETPLIVSTTGGVLAPLADRYSNRDLAVELKLPVVIAAPAQNGLVNAALLALDAVRGA